MGRPKGSRNRKHKRKYTRRKHNGLVPYPPSEAAKVLDLVSEVKEHLMRAKPDVAREAIPVLVEELTWLSKLIDSGHPAP